MTVLEYLELTFNSNDPYTLRSPVLCKDGFSISIQGGTHTHYCQPRRHCNQYDRVELGFPSQPDELIAEYAEDISDLTGTVYGYVLIEVVEKLIENHGGIVSEVTHEQ